MAHRVYLAIDIGASSGRHVAGLFDGRRIDLAEVHRFDNGPALAAGRMYWNLLRQWDDVKQGLRVAADRYASQIASIGVDTWGVDFALLGRNDELLGNPLHYRDQGNDGMLERAFEIVPREEIFQHTGLQFLQINTLYQLLALRLQNSSLLDAAESLLLIPDVFHWLLTGEKANELTNATTTQCFDPRTGNWAADLLARFGLPANIFGRIAAPGTRLGKIRPDVARQIGLGAVDIVLPGTHDTASAVMAVPAGGHSGERPNWCYISSGTWSLMGAEVAQPIINPACLRLNFTNEGGVGGTTRLLKNITGLWLVQECRRIWNDRGANYSWDDMTAMAERAAPLASVVDPDHPSLRAPADMPEAIVELCRSTGQSVPHEHGQVVRCALEAVAMKYRQVLGWLEELVGGRIETIHIVGGGTQNRQLCQMAADACGRIVLAGPVEATAIGNLMMQAVAAGDVGSIAEARDIIRASFPVATYQPRDTARWDEAFQRYRGIWA
jgi:rhamnulokinase